MGNCATCKWWVPEEGRLGGACHLNPPSTTFWGKTIWPKTSRRDSCSHHGDETTEAQKERARLGLHGAATKDTNILTAIPETKDYRLLVCSWYVRPGLRASVYRECTELIRENQPDGLKKAKRYLLIRETDILGWIISITNGPFYPKTGFEDVPNNSLDSPTLVPITLSRFFIRVGYRTPVGFANMHQNTRFGVLHPNKTEVTNLTTLSATSKESFEEDVLLELLESSYQDCR